MVFTGVFVTLDIILESIYYGIIRVYNRGISTSPNNSNSFLNIFGADLGDTQADFSVNQFGNYTAAFEKLPPPIPKEIWLTLFGIMLGTFLPSIVKWLNGWRQRKNLRKYIKQIDTNYYKWNESKKRSYIMKLYTEGKISETHYDMLKDRISEYSKDIKISQGAPVKLTPNTQRLTETIIIN